MSPVTSYKELVILACCITSHSFNAENI